jgi:NADH dehydrogenase [ubiquinone] 1 alpha subcomplex assembly factor 3
MLSLSSILRSSKASSRALHTARVLRNQKWSQLTNILAGEIPPPVQVKSISTEGLLLQDGRLFPSACIFLEGEVILWDVPPTLWSGWDESRFEIFDVVVPKPGALLLVHDGETRSSSHCRSPEILLIGTGKSVNPLPAALRRYLNKLGIQVDIMDSVKDHIHISTTSSLTLEQLHSGTLARHTICCQKRVAG